MAEHTKINPEKNTNDKHTKVRAWDKKPPNYTWNPNKRKTKETAKAIILMIWWSAAASYNTLERIFNTLVS